jgi:Biopolymer transport proteins
MNTWEMFCKGGIVMYPLAFFSLIGLTIILERSWYFFRARIDNTRFIDKVMVFLNKKDYGKALTLTEETKCTLSEVMSVGIRQCKAKGSIEEIEKVMERTGSKKLQGLEVNLNILSTIGNISPLLGLLGTVVGMVKCFMRIEKMGGRVDVSLLASGIWEALLTTVFGLTIAIPCLLFYSYFMGRIDRLEIRVTDISEDLLAIIKKERRMKLKRHHHQQIQLNIAPLVDMVFLLLIFFLLTSSFILNEGIKISLPEAKSSQMQDRKEITVGITKDGKIFLDEKPVSLQGLLTRLTGMIKDSPEKTVIIKADKGIILEKAVKVLDNVKQAGAKRIVVATEMELENR